MSHSLERNALVLLSPPTEAQWLAIRQRIVEKKWLTQSSWEYYALMLKLGYAQAVVSTDDSADIIGILVFAQPPNINITCVASYVVDEKHRGQGLGRKMWSVMEEHTDSSRICIIQSHSDMTPKYRAAGFPVPGETFQSSTGSVAQLNQALQTVISARKTQKTNQIRNIPNEVSIEKIAKFDRSILKFDRSAFLNAYFSFGQGKAMVQLNGDEEEVIAICGVFPGFNENEMRFGPIYGTEFDDALVLVQALITESNKSKYNIRMNMSSASGQRLAKFLFNTAGATMGADTIAARSFSRPLDIEIDWGRVFAISAHFASPLV